MKPFITIMSFLVIIGVVGVALNLGLGNQTVMYLTKTKIDASGLYAYEFNFYSYLDNLRMAISNTTELQLELPTRQWEWMTDIWNWEPLGNDLALILDYLIFGLNCLVYPLRIGAYLIRNILAILGINMSTNYAYNGMAWLVQLSQFLISIQIPYI